MPGMSPSASPPLPQVGRLNHVAIAVPDLAAASARYRDVLGAKVWPPRTTSAAPVRPSARGRSA
jgi:catechol-2,3-dioxygenase